MPAVVTPPSGSSSTGKTLSQSQIYTIALLSGLPEPKKMAAIAMAESSGNPRAHNYNPGTGDDSYGLWQINMLGDLGPERRRDLGISSNEELYNPLTNAMAAKKLATNSIGLRNWSVYKSGAYLKYMGAPVKKEAGSLDEVQQASWWDPLNIIPDGDGSILMPGLDGLGQIADSVWGIAESAQKAAFWIAQPKNWVRIAYVSVGGFVAIAAVISIASKTKAGTAVKRTAGNVVGGAMSVAPGGGSIRGASRAAAQSVKKKVTS